MEYFAATWALLTILVVSTNFVPFVAAQDAVLDIDGRPLSSGNKYYISPVTGGGVGLRMRNNTCPMYVVYTKNGLPAVFTPYSSGRGGVIKEGADLKVETSAVTVCVQSTRWRVHRDSKLDKYFVYTGDDSSSSSSIDLDYFRFDKSESGDDYVMVYCPSVCEFCRPYCGTLGSYSDEHGNGWLVIGEQANALKVQFRKA
uniref:Uncharacterized protein n=1 Tax=Araucaria cunninghamii TaxID=56994 RepID=A0A0D6QZE1_ARACU